MYKRSATVIVCWGPIPRPEEHRRMSSHVFRADGRGFLFSFCVTSRTLAFFTFVQWVSLFDSGEWERILAPIVFLSIPTLIYHSRARKGKYASPIHTTPYFFSISQDSSNRGSTMKKNVNSIPIKHTPPLPIEPKLLSGSFHSSIKDPKCLWLECLKVGKKERESVC